MNYQAICDSLFPFLFHFSLVITDPVTELTPRGIASIKFRTHMGETIPLREGDLTKGEIKFFQKLV